jgi:hypothetical protein
MELASEIESRGEIPIIGHLPWNPDPTMNAQVMALNDQIDAVTAADPHIVVGPDLYSQFDQHPEFWDPGGTVAYSYLSAAGDAAARTLWASAMLEPGGVYCH